MKHLSFMFLIFFTIKAGFASATASGEKAHDITSPDQVKESEIIDFGSIKDLIRKDGLEGELKKKEEIKRKVLTEKKRAETRKYNIPSVDNFWTVSSEYWLVKNAPRLKWDFHKPDFELEKAFAAFLESQGLFEKKFKILILDSSEIPHAALPTNDGEFIFLISLPFIRTLDLSKIEISILLFEDYVRERQGYFKKKVLTKELEEILGTNFEGKSFDKNLLKKHLDLYSKVLFESGFTFQEQFEVTKEMDSLLKNDLKIWNTYIGIIEKIDQLIKSNGLYKNYGQIFPSPELQLNWLKPKKQLL